MLKVATFYFLLGFMFLKAQGIESELGIYVGMSSTKNDDGNKFQNPTFGLTYQDNKYVVMPRVDLEYTKVKDDYASSLLKGSINAVYEYENSTYTVPYALAGIGYEYVSGGVSDVFESHPFVQGGAGVRVDLEEGFKARLEGKVLQVLSSNNEGNELLVTAGVSMPFDIAKPFGTKQRAKRKYVAAEKQKVVIPRSKVIRPKLVSYKPVNQKVSVVHSNNNECPIKISAPDFDRDGVANSIDQCPATPCNFTVDRYGCPVKTTLQIHFASNSANIQSSSFPKIYGFADFLLRHKGSMVNIVGHTDSVGPASHNLALSNSRAYAVMNVLVERGISPARLRAFGRGESEAIASNKTASGKAMNRRIEAELIYLRGRK